MKTIVDRRAFLRKIGYIGIAIGIPGRISSNVIFNNTKKKSKFDIDNPYQSVNWEKTNHIKSTSHIHITDQAGLNKAAELGYRHLPISNYYPSAPYYPIDQVRENQFKVKQNFGVMRLRSNEEPVFIEGPIEWNKVIMDKETGWYNSLPIERQQELPFKVGDYIFKEIPDNIIFSPNAEHHAFTNTKVSIHANSIGSMFSSGTFDSHSKFKTFWNGGKYSYGTGLHWQDAFNKMLDQLLFKDGGGITINHPTWSKLDQSIIEEKLDFDSRVLGIEVFNQGTWSLEMWDNLLKTGRRCLGFLVPDWGVQDEEAKDYRGFNVLLVNDFTEHSCLKAYRDGAFFGSEYGGDLSFNEISLKSDKLVVKTNGISTITIITDQGISKMEKDTTGTIYSIPVDSNNVPIIKYIRIEAENGAKERIFSQPIRFTRK